MVVVVPSAQGNAGHLESYTQSTPGLQVEIIRAFEIGRDWHGCAPLVACQAGAQSVSQPSVPDCWLLLANDGNSIRQNQHLTIKSEYLQFEQMGLLLTPAWSVRRNERQD
jgi:hypothetical protein